jgi:hypothetical protein
MNMGDGYLDMHPKRGGVLRGSSEYNGAKSYFK